MEKIGKTLRGKTFVFSKELYYYYFFFFKEREKRKPIFSL